MSLDVLTIILTIKDRSEFTFRWMQYMNDAKCPYKILVADGGADAFVELSLTEHNNYPNINYDYFRYPFDSDYSYYYKKLYDVIEKVKTPYVLLADNDDFFIFDEFPLYIEFLNNNIDYVSCSGSHAILEILSKYNVILNQTKGDKYVINQYLNKHRSIEHSAITDRVCYFLENVDKDNLWMGWYSIHRTKAIKEVFNKIKTHYYSEIVVFEIYFRISLLVLGKCKEYTGLYYVRQEGTSQLTAYINSEFNLVERFIKFNVFSEIIKAIELLPYNFSENEKDIIIKAISYWFAYQSKIIYSISAVKNFFFNIIYTPLIKNENIFIASISLYVTHKIRNFNNNNKRKNIKLPIIEKYILNQ
jgi:glycosyltransferase domain-containing protein